MNRTSPITERDITSAQARWRRATTLTSTTPQADLTRGATEVRRVDTAQGSTRTPARSAHPVALAIETSDRDGWTVLDAEGELDVYTAPWLRARFREIIGQGGTHLIVDLSEISFIDAAGLGSLVGALKAARVAHGELRLVGQPALARLLEITGLRHALPLFTSTEAAVPVRHALRDQA